MKSGCNISPVAQCFSVVSWCSLLRRLLEECDEKSLAQILSFFFLSPPPQALCMGWKSTSICLEMSPASLQSSEGSMPTPLCTCVSAHAVLEGNNLAPVELLVEPVWSERVVRSVSVHVFSNSQLRNVILNPIHTESKLKNKVGDNLTCQTGYFQWWFRRARGSWELQTHKNSSKFVIIYYIVMA